MVEGARLESVYSGNAIAGSNPALSAKENQCLGIAGGIIISASIENLLS